ncbi:MAG: hypothetical protein ABSB40_08170 [Nitrososphaeria archaeon]
MKIVCEGLIENGVPRLLEITFSCPIKMDLINFVAEPKFCAFEGMANP